MSLLFPVAGKFHKQFSPCTRFLDSNQKITTKIPRSTILRGGPAASKDYLAEGQGAMQRYRECDSLSGEQCLLEAKRSHVYSLKMVNGYFLPQMKYREPQKLRHDLGISTGILTAHTPWGYVARSPRCAPGKRLAHQASLPWMSQCKDWAYCPGHRRSESQQHCGSPVLPAPYPGKCQPKVAELVLYGRESDSLNLTFLASPFWLQQFQQVTGCACVDAALRPCGTSSQVTANSDTSSWLWTSASYSNAASCP